MSSYSKSKVSAFFGSHHDNSLRESIRQDVLFERYDDLQKEMEHLESLLNISEEKSNEDLFIINDMLFDLIEELIPEMTSEEETEKLEEEHDCDDVHLDKNREDMEEKNDDEESVDEVAPLAARGAVAAAKSPAGSKVVGKIAKGAIKKSIEKGSEFAKNKEAIMRARSLVRTAQLDTKAAKNPESKRKIRTTLARARQQLAKKAGK